MTLIFAGSLRRHGLKGIKRNSTNSSSNTCRRHTSEESGRVAPEEARLALKKPVAVWTLALGNRPPRRLSGTPGKRPGVQRKARRTSKASITKLKE